MAPKPYFRAIFPIFRLFFSYFLGEAKTYIFPIFFLFRAGGPKPIRGWPVGNRFSRPSKNGFWGGQLRGILSISKGLTKRNGKGGGGKTYRGEGGRKPFSVGGLLVRFCPPLFFAPPFGVLWFLALYLLVIFASLLDSDSGLCVCVCVCFCWAALR